MVKNKSKQDRKVVRDTDTSAKGSTSEVDEESRSLNRGLCGKIKEGLLNVLRAPTPSTRRERSSIIQSGPGVVDDTHVIVSLTPGDGQVRSNFNEATHCSLEAQGSPFTGGLITRGSQVAGKADHGLHKGKKEMEEGSADLGNTTGDAAMTFVLTKPGDDISFKPVTRDSYNETHHPVVEDPHFTSVDVGVRELPINAQDAASSIPWLDQHAQAISSSIKDKHKLDKSVTDPSDVPKSKVAMPAESRDRVPEKPSPSSVTHFFQGASRFEINDAQFNSAGRDINITTNYLDDRSLSMLAYAEGAGIDTRKACLKGTRMDILEEIKAWVIAADTAAPRVLWLSGPAGTGKSAIAHTIAHWWMDEVRGFGSCFCFNQQSSTRYQKLVTTVARDLAARIPGLKDHLIKIVTGEPALASTPDITQQWRKLIEAPVTCLAKEMSKHVLIVIDALDESGDTISRRDILSILKDAKNLPSNFRILVTSRPLHDISRVFSGAAGIQPKSMNQISKSSSESDIHLYIAGHLRDLSDFDDGAVTQLVQKSDGLFEWARLACEYIKSADDDFLTEREKLKKLIVHAGQGMVLLDNMYTIILQSIMGNQPSNVGLHRFCSVLQLALSTQEPLPMDALDVLYRNMCKEHDDYVVATVLQRFGSLLSGIYDQSMPVCAIHSTFYEFLTTQERSGIYFVDLDNIHLDLGHACLDVMQKHLHFNICKLKSPYLHNSEIAQLGQYIKDNIKPYLSYSCHYWADHIKLAPYQASLGHQISTFILNERMLFWLEVLCLLNLVHLAPVMLSNVASWLQGHDHHEAVEAAMDGIKFCRMFGGMMSSSTPHLYLSALPFLPRNSILSRCLTPKFPRVARIASGQVEEWPHQQLLIRGHSDVVNSIAYSQDGKRIASGSKDQTVCIWDADTGMQVGGPLKGHTDNVTSVAFSPDGKRIASGSEDQTVCIWDAETVMQIGSPLKGHTHWVTSVAFSPDGKKIASGSMDQTVCIWDVDNGIQVCSPLKGHTHWVTSVAFSPDGKRIVSGSGDQTLCIWDADTGTQVASPLKGHTSHVSSVAFSPDGKKIASGSWDKTVCIWDADTRIQMGSLLKGHTDYVSSVAFSADGKKIASGSWDQVVCIWDADAGVQVNSPLKGHTDYVSSVVVFPDGRIASGSWDQTVCIWDPDTGMQVGSPPKQHTHWVTSVVFSPDGKKIATGSWDQTVCIWDAATVAFSPDGKKIASGSNDQTVCIWDADTGMQVGHPLTGHTDYVSSVAFSPDGELIASGSGDQHVCIWDAETGMQMGSPLKGHTSHITSVAFSADGKKIASGSEDQTVCIWNPDTRIQVGNPLKGHTDCVSSVAFSPDGKKIASGSRDQTVCIWDADTGMQVGSPLKGHSDWVRSVAFSPDGKQIASGSEDQTVCIWDTDTGIQVGNPLRGHTDCVSSVTFSPDGYSIASSSYDQTVCIWGADTGMQMCSTLKEHISSASLAAFQQDAKGVASGSRDQNVCIWDSGMPQDKAEPSFVDLKWSALNRPINVIKFSFTKEHALSAPSQLFENTPEFQMDWRHHIILHPSGWLTGPQGHLLMWLPPGYQKPFLLPRMQAVIPHPVIQLDLSMMVHGTMWDKCYEV